MSTRPILRLFVLTFVGFLLIGAIQLIFAIDLVNGMLGLMFFAHWTFYVDAFFYLAPLVLTWVLIVHAALFYYPSLADKEYHAYLAEHYPTAKVILYISLFALLLVIGRELIVPLFELREQAMAMDRGDRTVVETMRDLAASRSVDSDVPSATIRLRYLVLAGLPLLMILFVPMWRPRRPVIYPAVFNWIGAIFLMVILSIGYQALIQAVAPFFLSIYPVIP